MESQHCSSVSLDTIIELVQRRDKKGAELRSESLRTPTARGIFLSESTSAFASSKCKQTLLQTSILLCFAETIMHKQEKPISSLVHAWAGKQRLINLPTTTSRVHIKYIPLLKQVAYWRNKHMHMGGKTKNKTLLIYKKKKSITKTENKHLVSIG